MSWHRCDRSPVVALCPSSEPTDLAGEVRVLVGARFKFSG